MTGILEFINRYFNFIFALVVGGMYFNALLFLNMGVDAAYFIRVTECIAGGAVPEHDLRILYPPMVFYMLLPVKLLAGNSIAYEYYLGFMFVIQFINGYLLCRIAHHYTRNGFISVFAALLYLFLSIKLEGEYLFLEPFVNFWGLLGIYCYLIKGRTNPLYLILSGVLVFLSFLTKQYGLAYAALIILLIISDHASIKELIKPLIIFTLSVFSSILFYIVLFRIGYGEWYDFLAGGKLSTYGEKSIPGFLSAIVKYLYISPYLVFFLVPPIISRVFKKQHHLAAYLLFLAMLSVQFFLNVYDHYYLLVLPALLISGMMLYDTYIPTKRILTILILFGGLLLNEFLIGDSTYNHLFSNRESLSLELRKAEEIKEIIPENSRTYIVGDVKLYYLCRLNPAHPEKYGFLYNNALSISDLRDCLSNAEYLLVPKTRMNEQHQLTDGSILVSDLTVSGDLVFEKETMHYMIFRNQALNKK